MKILLSLLLVLLQNVLTDKAPLNRYITWWEGIDQEQVQVVEKREAFAPHPISFTIFLSSRTLKLHLYPDNSLYHGSEHSVLEGSVEGVAESTARGYIDENHHFIGWISLSDVRYHIEPAERHFSLPEFTSVVYTASVTADILYQDGVLGAELSGQLPEETKPTRAKRGLRNLRNRTCPILLAADHLFFQHIGRSDRKYTANELILHLGEANKIFRSTDFDFDGRSDNIGFSVANITIFERENMAENKFYGEIVSSSDYLVRWSEYDHSMFCLALCFTYRDFNAGVLGLAYVGARDRTGGICDQRFSVNGQRLSYNTGIISMMNFGAYVGHDVSFITVAHELGHNFGASHDPATSNCSPGSSDGGNFVMFDKATNGNLPHNSVFSPCSRHAMLNVLQTPTKVRCFREESSFCGNGIKEWGEECDCGNTVTCSSTDPCCTPVDDPGPDEPCTIRRSHGFQCSFSAGECCKESCQFSSNDTMCRPEQDCAFSTNCSGLTGHCDVSHQKGIIPCNADRNTCLNGTCKGSVCKLADIEECQCAGNSLCDVCCSTNQGCISTKHLPHLGLKLTYLGAGRACNNYHGYCDEVQRCVTVNLEGPLSALDEVFNKRSLQGVVTWLQEHWYYTLSMVAGVIGVIILFKYTYVRRAPIQRALQKVSATLRRQPLTPLPQCMNEEGWAYPRAPLDTLNPQHHPIPLDIAVNRLTALFPTTPSSILPEIARAVGSEEIAVKRLLALGYPMYRNPHLPSVNSINSRIEEKEEEEDVM